MSLNCPSTFSPLTSSSIANNLPEMQHLLRRALLPHQGGLAKPGTSGKRSTQTGDGGDGRVIPFIFSPGLCKLTSSVTGGREAGLS